MTQLTNIAWFMKYMPTKIEDFIFNNEQDKTMVQQWIENEKIDGNILLYGPPGTGKTTLSTILINTIIKSQNDIYRMKERSVNEIDKYIKPFIIRRAVKSKQKIVYIEEIDKLSNQGQVALKEDCLEKYQHIVSFICCTNYINKIDKALLTRFTYKLQMNNPDETQLYNRIKFILDNEGAIYDENKLKLFIEVKKKIGLRDMINLLQLEYNRNNKQITFELNENELFLEGQITNIILNIFDKIINIQNINDIQLCHNMPLNSIIKDEWQNLISVLNNNLDLNYNLIFEELYNNTTFLPLQIIIGKYLETVDSKKLPHLHIISCVYDSIKCLGELRGTMA